MYDRAAARKGSRTPIVVLEKPNGSYVLRKGYLEGTYIRNTDRLEEEIFKKMQVGGERVVVGAERVASEMENFLSASTEQIDIALSVMDKNSESNVDRIMKEVLSLSPKERADLLVAILDIL